jgi:carboxypeptidase Taq
MLKDLPNYDELLEKGEISPITNWLTEHIHQYGKMKKPLEILNDVTGEGLNVDYLIQYLEKKYGEIYHV